MKRSWGPTAPPGPWDVLVIGAGIGGLGAAGLLAQLGHKVLVLEQHTVPGGFTQSFRRAGWSWDVGLHIVGEMGPRGLAGRVLGALSGHRLEWTRIGQAYDAAELPDGRVVEFLPRLHEGFTRAFPREAKNLARYQGLLRKAASAMRTQFVARSMTPWLARPAAGRELALSRTADVLDSVTTDPGLRATLGLHWGFYGTLPTRSAFGVHALLTRHYRDGAFYPVGGAMSLARTMSAELEKHGGWIRVQADVQQLLVKHGRAIGVRLKSGEELFARTVVSAAGAHNTLKLLPEEERRQDWAEGIAALPSSLPHCAQQVGFKGDIRAAGATETNRWVIDHYTEEPWSCRGRPPHAYVAFPSLKDGSTGDLHTAEILGMCEWAPFAEHADSRWRHRPEGYEALKAELTRHLLELLFERHPRLKPLMQYAELSTPLSTVHFARGVNGAAYGLESTPERYLSKWLKPRTPVSGLYLAGSDVSMVGVAPALVGGLAAAVAIEPEKASAWLKRAVRYNAKSSRKVA